MILLLTPPMVQVNAPYAATPLLAGFLRDEKIPFAQADLSLGLALRLFSQPGLEELRGALQQRRKLPRSAKKFLAQFDAYHHAITPAVRFLQTHDPALAHRVAQPGFLPDGWRLAQAHAEDADDALFRLFGQCGTHDRATHLASLFLDEIADVARDGIDTRFAFSRYAESLAQSLPSFTPLLEALDDETLFTRWLDELTVETLRRHNPRVVAVTCPFPGTLLAAFRIARRVKSLMPATRVALGGGYPSTELRELDDPRVFDFFDVVALDDGRATLRALWQGRPPATGFTRENGRVVFHHGTNPPVSPPPRPDFTGLPLDDYLSLVEMPNPMHRLWSDACWLKLPLTNGCYWRKCAFCDTSLPHIKNFSQPAAARVVENLFALHAETGKSAFHFTDEALPPKLVGDMSAELTARGAPFTWWGNVRFERAFTRGLARRMADAGCVAVTGGLECANDRLLALMKKGVTLRGARGALRAFADAGILTHAYLIYGFPTQAFDEVLDALEFVRQCFAEGVLQSAFWHRFTLTAHSPVLRQPETFNVAPSDEILRAPRFARNAVPYVEKGACDWDAIGAALHRATYNYMMGVGLDAPVGEWFH
ncbi:MAG: radical SAM protein [Kiritimatiellaeota bacterium]|nr:radical SAM protein [Kiritimatiellota bacterium]